jgi:hypothetical protein
VKFSEYRRIMHIVHITPPPPPPIIFWYNLPLDVPFQKLWPKEMLINSFLVPISHK